MTANNLTAAELVELIRPKRRSIKRVTSFQNGNASSNVQMQTSVTMNDISKHDNSTFGRRYYGDNHTAPQSNNTSNEQSKSNQTNHLKNRISESHTMTLISKFNDSSKNFDKFTATNSNLNLNLENFKSNLTLNLPRNASSLELKTLQNSAYKAPETFARKRSSLALPTANEDSRESNQSNFYKSRKSNQNKFRRNTQDIGSLPSSVSFPEKMSFNLQDKISKINFQSKLEEETFSQMSPVAKRIYNFEKLSSSKIEERSSPSREQTCEQKYDKSERSVGSESQYFSFDGSFNEENCNGTSSSSQKSKSKNNSTPKDRVRRSRGFSNKLNLSSQGSQGTNIPAKVSPKKFGKKTHTKEKIPEESDFVFDKFPENTIENHDNHENQDPNDQTSFSSEASFFKNGGISQYGSGVNLNMNVCAVQNQLNKLTLKYSTSSNSLSQMQGFGSGYSANLFTAALLKAEKQRRIQRWVDRLVVESEVILV